MCIKSCSLEDGYRMKNRNNDSVNRFNRVQLNFSKDIASGFTMPDDLTLLKKKKEGSSGVIVRRGLTL